MIERNENGNGESGGGGERVENGENGSRGRIVSNVPIMHTPGEIFHVANMFDNRLFDENTENNIEFHIHAYLSPAAA
jgi:hypothetical protein